MLIDLGDGGIAPVIERLPYKVLVRGILFEYELRARHSNLIDYGIVIESSAEDSILEVQTMIRRFPRISRNDAVALLLAMEKQCVLLTGNKNLRAAAETCEIEVHGTIHLIQHLVASELLSIEELRSSLVLVRSRGRRLPWAVIERTIGFEL